VGELGLQRLGEVRQLRGGRASARGGRADGHPAVEAARPDGAGRLVLEGGGIETTATALMLVTEEWLLSDVQVRNPGMGRDDYERAFAEWLGITRTIWLGEGCVGDDTHGHVDDIARFVDPHTVVLAYEPDPADENHGGSRTTCAAGARGEGLPQGLARRDASVPAPGDHEGERLPASYANFYIANGVVIVPTFNDRNDRDRAEHPGRALPRPRGGGHPRRGPGVGAGDAALPDAAAARASFAPGWLGVKVPVFGTWRSPVAHLNGVQGVAGSNPAVPTWISEGPASTCDAGPFRVRYPSRGGWGMSWGMWNPAGRRLIPFS
jgi:hypothetical protein